MATFSNVKTDPRSFLLNFIASLIILKAVTAVWTEDICSKLEELSLNVRLEENGVLEAKRLLRRITITGSPSGQCLVHLLTCSDCHFALNLSGLKLPTCGNNNACICDNVSIQESGYRFTEKTFCGFRANETIAYTSNTNHVIIKFLYSGLHVEPFTITFRSLRNVYAITGGINSTGSIRSVGFPEKYPEDYGAFYVFRGSTGRSKVQLMFTDFLLSRSSYIEVLDPMKNQRIGVYFGGPLRPPAITSAGEELEIHFAANDNSDIGFTIEYTFLQESYSPEKPVNTSCGGTAKPFGGVIILSHAAMKYDCIWIVDPPQNNILQWLSIRVEKFEHASQDSRLEIRKGRTSAAPKVQVLSGFDVAPIQNSSFDYNGLASDGLYIRLRGEFTLNSSLVIVYTAFGSRVDCSPPELFQCQSGQCILMSLTCDGFNHCRDGSDESSVCFEDFARLHSFDMKTNRWWDQNSSSRFLVVASSRTTDVPLLVCSLGLVWMVVAMIVVMCWLCCKGKNRPSSTPNYLQSAFGIFVPHMEDRSVSSPESPPSYEPPPSYEDIMKVMNSIQQTESPINNETEQPKSGSRFYEVDFSEREEETSPIPLNDLQTASFRQDIEI